MDPSIYHTDDRLTASFRALINTGGGASSTSNNNNNPVLANVSQGAPWKLILKRTFYHHADKLKQCARDRVDAFKVRSRWDIVCQEESKEVYRDEGESRLHHLLDTLETLNDLTSKQDMPLSTKQRTWHLQMLVPSLPYIVGPQRFKDNSRKYISILGAQEVLTNCFITAPRREGKTVGIAFFVSCLLRAVPDALISVFSQSQRASGKMMKEIITFYSMFPAAKDSIIRNNAEELSIRIDGNVRSLFCYPAAVNSKLLCVFNFNF
jgi:hypothetical protein